MNIREIRLFDYSLPLRDGWRLGTARARSGVLVRVQTDAAAGWGDVAPLPGFSGESLEDARETLLELRPSLVGLDLAADFASNQKLLSLLADVPPSIRFGVELACFSALANAAHIPLRKWLAGDAARNEVRINGLLAGDRKAMIESVSDVAGFSCVKVKVGRQSPEEDARMVRDIRRALGDSVKLRLDANRRWNKEEAVRFGKLLDVEIEYVEEPLRNPMDLPEWHAATSLAFALDETLADTPLRVWGEFRGLAALVLKPTLMGGISRAMRFSKWAKEHARRCVVSAAFESGVGLSGLLQLGAAVGDEATAMGLDTYRWLASDVLREPLSIGAQVVLDDLNSSSENVAMERIKEVSRG